MLLFPASNKTEWARRRAAMGHEGALRGPWPDRTPKATKRPREALGSRPMYRSDEGFHHDFLPFT